jgi:hypothetical protein
MTSAPDPTDDPASTRGPGDTADAEVGSTPIDQLLEDAEGGIEGSTLDAPDT